MHYLLNQNYTGQLATSVIVVVVVIIIIAAAAAAAAAAIIIIIIIIIITLIQDIYNILETNYFSMVYNVAAILQLQFMTHVMLFSMLNVLYIIIIIIVVVVVVVVAVATITVHNTLCL